MNATPRATSLSRGRYGNLLVLTVYDVGFSLGDAHANSKTCRSSRHPRRRRRRACAAGRRAGNVDVPDHPLHRSEHVAGAEQMLDISDATNGPLFGAALTAFNATQNSDTILQNATSFTAAGQLVSPQFFPFGGPSVPVNSNVAVVGHVTAPGTAGATNYFGFAETARRGRSARRQGDPAAEPGNRAASLR